MINAAAGDFSASVQGNTLIIQNAAQPGFATGFSMLPRRALPVRSPSPSSRRQ